MARSTSPWAPAALPAAVRSRASSCASSARSAARAYAVAASLFAPREAARSPARASVSQTVFAELSGFVGVGLELERGEVMRGDDLDDLLLATRPRRLEERGCGEMPGLAIALRERLVRDVSHEVLEEAVLPPFGRAGVGLEEEDLLAHERAEGRLDAVVRCAGDRGDCIDDERLAEDRRVLDEFALGRLEAVDARGDERVQRLGHRERVDLPDDR